MNENELEKNFPLGKNENLNPSGILHIRQNSWPNERLCWLDYISISKSVYNIYEKSRTFTWNNLVRIYIFEDSSDLENLPLVKLEWNLCDDLLNKLHFLTNANTTTRNSKNQFFNYFWRILLKLEEKILPIHKHIWPWITWTLKKQNSIQTLV